MLEAAGGGGSTRLAMDGEALARFGICEVGARGELSDESPYGFRLTMVSRTGS
jgi:hypothetical protein